MLATVDSVANASTRMDATGIFIVCEVKFDVPTSPVYLECCVGEREIGYKKAELEVWLMMVLVL